MHIAPPAQTCIFATLCITSWSLVEVPRYLFYAVKEITDVPYALLWLRYSLFAILYPTGITGELGCMYYGAKYLLNTKVRCTFSDEVRTRC
jgi:very-long-chain (3R)-3-hydroxyacyl-CoA dehydratase